MSNVSISGNSCAENSVAGLEEILSTLVLNIDNFDILKYGEEANIEEIESLIKQKKIKKYIQTKFVEDFNKKPGKSVDKLRKLFNDKISAKDIAIIIR